MPTAVTPTPTSTGIRVGAMRFPVDLSGTLVGRELAELTAEHRRLTTDVQRLRSERDDLANAGRKRAEAADADALGRAMRSGSKDPGATHIREHTQALADAERQVAGAQRALALVEQDIRVRLAEQGPAYLADLATLTDAARERTRDAVAALAGATNDVQRLRRVGIWLTSGKPAEAPAMYVPGLTKGLHGEAYTTSQVLDALGDAVR